MNKVRRLERLRWRIWRLVEDGKEVCVSLIIICICIDWIINIMIDL